MLVIRTWDGNNINDGTNYIAGFSPGGEWGLPSAPVRNVRREGAWPTTTGIDRAGHELQLFISIENGANVRTLRGQLLRWFDPEDETPKRLVIADDDAGTNPRYVLAVCRELRPINIGPVAACDLFRVTLAVDGDVRWRATTATSVTWNITASGQTRVIANTGEDDAYPVFTIRPTAAKTGGYAHRHWVPVAWRSQNAGADYPVMVSFDTATPIAATEMAVDGADLRVLVDGVEVGRTIEAINTAATKVWFVANFTRAPQLTLRTGFLAGDTVTSLDLDDEVEMALLPDTGTVLIGSEAFVYTGRSLINRQLTGVTRAANGTTAATHAVAADVWWIQRDVQLLYGNAAPAAPPSNYYPPVFDTAASSNTSWVYAGNFGDSTLGPWPGAWTNTAPITASGAGYGCYTATELDLAWPFEVLGVWRDWSTASAAFAQAWQLYNPCGIVNAAWSGGKIRGDLATYVSNNVSMRYWVRGASWWENQHRWALAINPLPAVNTWYTQAGWGAFAPSGFGNAAASPWSAADWILLARYAEASYFEVSGVTVTLNSAETPLVTVGAQQGNYSLTPTLANTTTGEALTVTYTMDVDANLRVNTDLRTVTDLADGSGQFQAVSLDSARRQWLRLLPGNNTLRWTDAGTNGVTVTVTWEARYY
jgi:hypothetical protein